MDAGGEAEASTTPLLLVEVVEVFDGGEGGGGEAPSSSLELDDREGEDEEEEEGRSREGKGGKGNFLLCGFSSLTGGGCGEDCFKDGGPEVLERSRGPEHSAEESRSCSFLDSLLSLLPSNLFTSFLLSFGFRLPSAASGVLVAGKTGLARLLVMYCCRYILLSSWDFR